MSGHLDNKQENWNNNEFSNKKNTTHSYNVLSIAP